METEDRIRRALADRYAIEAAMDSGGMAMVYRARELKHDRTVAIKVLRTDLAEAIGADRLDRGGQPPIEDAVQIAREVADALAYAQREGVIHRDIRPANFLWSGVMLCWRISGSLRAGLASMGG